MFDSLRKGPFTLEIYFSVFKRRFQVYGFVIVLLNRLNSKIQVMFVLWCVLFRNDLLNICMHAICCFCVRVVFICFLLIFDRYCLTQARLTRGASCRLAIMGSQTASFAHPEAHSGYMNNFFLSFIWDSYLVLRKCLYVLAIKCFRQYKLIRCVGF